MTASPNDALSASFSALESVFRRGSQTTTARPRPPSPKKEVYWKNREGCGCPKFLAGWVFQQTSTLLEIIPRFSGSTECYSCQGLGTFRQGIWERSWISPQTQPQPFDTEYDRTKVPPYNGSDPSPPPEG